MGPNALPLQLPGPDRRAWAIEKALQRGQAALYLVLSNMPSDVTLNAEAEQRHTQICRLVVPVESDKTPAPAAPASSEEKAK